MDLEVETQTASNWEAMYEASCEAHGSAEHTVVQNTPDAPPPKHQLMRVQNFQPPQRLPKGMPPLPDAGICLRFSELRAQPLRQLMATPRRPQEAAAQQGRLHGMERIAEEQVRHGHGKKKAVESQKQNQRQSREAQTRVNRKIQRRSGQGGGPHPKT